MTKPSGAVPPPAVDQEMATLEVAREIMLALARMGRALKGRLGEPTEAPTTYFLLYLIDASGPLRTTELATVASLDHSTVSRHITHLLADGTVSRRPDPNDGRAWQVELTDAGRELLSASIDRRASVLADAIQIWSASDRADLARLLDQLTDTLTHQHIAQEIA